MAINPRSVRSIGLSLIVFGALSVIFGLASDLSFSDAYLHQASGPIWSGVFVLITGILAASIHYEKGNRCIMIALTTLGTLSVLLTIASWVMSSIGLNGRDTCPVSSCLAVKALHGVSLVLSVVETVLSCICVILGCVGIWSPQDHSTSPPPYPQQQFATPTQQPVVIVQASPGVPVSSPPPGVSPGVQYVYVPVSAGDQSLHPSPHAQVVASQGASPQQVIYTGQRLSPGGGQGASSSPGQGSASQGQRSGQGTTGRRRGKPAPPPPYEATEGDFRQPPINPEFSGRI
ncbi:uncharacterized protein LOC144877012 isoform X2 [Branchiostoma floridae x Branchiostoma japonicum]